MFAGSGDAVHHAKKGRFSNNNNSNNNSKVDKHGCEPLECPQPKKNLENVVMDTSGTYASTRKTRPSVHHDNASDLSPAPRAAILASPMPSSPRSNTRPSLLLNDLTWSTDHKAGGLELNVEASEPSWAVRPRDKKALPGHWSYSDGLRPSCSTIADRHHTYGGWATQLPPATVDMNMEQELIPMSEEQKPLIHQPCRALHASSGKVGLSQCSPDISSLEREANMNDTLATMELRLQAILRENKRLQHENEELKREMERMRVPRRENGC
ncbi:hypothetical protein BX666DRAFT_310254 [Dichotomocladium elegans]|nr:hypothetical protein BX666DRAFT_310254 [Dichotomocladium elegans]